MKVSARIAHGSVCLALMALLGCSGGNAPSTTGTDGASAGTEGGVESDSGRGAAGGAGSGGAGGAGAGDATTGAAADAAAEAGTDAAMGTSADGAATVDGAGGPDGDFPAWTDGNHLEINDHPVLTRVEAPVAYRILRLEWKRNAVLDGFALPRLTEMRALYWQGNPKLRACLADALLAQVKVTFDPTVYRGSNDATTPCP